MENDSENLCKKNITEQRVASNVFGRQDGFATQASTSSSNLANIFGQTSPSSLFGQVANVTSPAHPFNITDPDRDLEKSKVCSAKDLFGNTSQPTSSTFTQATIEKDLHTDATIGQLSFSSGVTFPLYKASDSMSSYQEASPSFTYSKPTDHPKSLEGLGSETPVFSFARASETSQCFTGLAFSNPMFRSSNPIINSNELAQSALPKILTGKSRPSPSVFGSNIEHCESFGYLSSTLTPVKVFSSSSSSSENFSKSKSDHLFEEKSISSTTYITHVMTDDKIPVSLSNASDMAAHIQSSNLLSKTSKAPELDSHQMFANNSSKNTPLFGFDHQDSNVFKSTTLPPLIVGNTATSEGDSLVSPLHSSNKPNSTGTQKEKTKELSIFGGNGQSAESKNLPMNIFGSSTASNFNASSLFCDKQTLFASRPISSSVEKGNLIGNTLSNDSVTEISLQHITEEALDEDIFGITNFEGNKESVEKKLKPTSLIAVNVDENFLNKSILKTHFSRFGTVNKILINKKSNQASVFFDDHDSAAEAKANGKSLHPKIPEMKLFYGAVTDDEKKPKIIVSKIEESISKSERTPKSDRLTSRQIISYEDIEQLPFVKPHAPMPKTKSSNKPLVKRASTRQPVLIKSSILSKSGSPHLVSKPSENLKPISDLPSKVFGSERNKSHSSEGKPPRSIQKEDSSKKNDMRSKAPSAHIASVKDNSLLIKLQAYNNYDKYLVLDARDKCIRLTQEKILDVNKAHYLLATCPDMCPEKERYSRDIQYDLSVYELTDGILDHNRSVKKFSRSSADKDEPLPHELRSGPVLKTTMDYLVCNIIDNETQVSQLDVWYNYLCNRTRALRNDIMTQHLVDNNAVYVLEKITRFHIHCSHHLCEEPADLFDSKMNAEHLTKSLQSLKELYHDMSENNVFYDSEAEFRAYEILLDAKDGNVIFQYLNFRDSVRNSSYVQFAVKVLNAIQSNNFVKFFKLLTKATYLQACIMHRHFLSIRCKALNVIAKAYSLPKESQAIPVARVMNMLGFSNEDNFENFISYFGFSIDESKINISKNCFPIAYEQLPPLKKSADLVAFKNQTSTGLIVQGGTLPRNPLEFYNPHNSFDSAGYLKSDAFDASDQREKVSFDDLSYQEKIRKTLLEPIQVPKHKNNDDIKRELMEKVILMHKLNLEKKFFNAWKQYFHNQKQKKILAKRTLTKKMVDRWKNFVATNSELNLRADKFIMAKYFYKLKKNTVLSKESKKIKLKVKYLNERILTQRVVNNWKKMVNEKKLQLAIHFLRKRVISRKFFINWRLKTILSKLERRIDLYYKSKLQKICLAKWKAWLIMKKGQRKVDLESFPACGSQLPLQTQNDLWSWGYNRKKSVNLSVFEISNLDMEIKNLSNKQVLLQKLSGMIAWSTLPLIPKCQLYIDSQFIKYPSYNFLPPFKIVLTIDPLTDSYLVEWIRTKLNFNEFDKIDGRLISRVTLNSHLDGSEYHLVVEEEETVAAERNDASLRIFACNKTNLAASKQLASIQSDILSLVLCCSFADESPQFERDTWLLNKEAIDSPATSEKLFGSIYESWKLFIGNTEVKKSSLHALVDSFITKKVIGPVFHAAGKVIKFGQPFLSPSVFVTCYNDGLTHIIQCLKQFKIIDGVLLENWNDEIVDKICYVISSAHLPKFEVHNWPFCDDVMGYLSMYLKNVTNNSDWCGNLITEVKKIINVSSLNCNSSEDEDKNEMNLKAIEIPWLDVMSCCIFYKISCIPTNFIVFYDLNLMENFNIDHWICELKNSEIQYCHRLGKRKNNDHKRKAPLIPQSSQPKLKQKKISSQLLEELAEEKKAYLNMEGKFEELNEIETELQILQTKYLCK